MMTVMTLSNSSLLVLDLVLSGMSSVWIFSLHSDICVLSLCV